MNICKTIKWTINDIYETIELKIDDIITYLRPSYRDVIMFTLPGNMPNNEWVTIEASMDELKFVGVIGRYRKTGMWSAKCKIKFIPTPKEKKTETESK